MKNKFVYPSEGTKSSGSGNSYVYNEGITKRELFAAMAMQGFLSNVAIIDSHTSEAMDWITRHSIWQADSLLKELENTNK